MGQSLGDNLLKGPEYEFRLALHFMVRAILHDYHDCALACYLPAAGKFDDVVFRYQRTKRDHFKCRFVQAKNVKGPVTLTEMRKETGDFSLPKYFLLFRT
jgi:hypothetical protein